MDMHTLRAGLIAKYGSQSGRFYKSRKIESLSPGMQAQLDQLRHGASGKSASSALSRLNECGEDDDWGGTKACRIAACPRCFMNYRRKETGINIKKRFAGVPNEKLAFFTILLDPILDLGSAYAGFENAKRRMRNMADRKCREDDRWHDVQWVGFLEIDRTSLREIKAAGRNTQLFFRDYLEGAWLGEDDTIWTPHMHGIVELGDLTANEFAETLRSYGTSFRPKGKRIPYQVDVKPFDVSRRVEENLRDTTRYSLKFRIEDDFKGKSLGSEDDPKDKASAYREWWSREDIRVFVGFLATCRGFQKLRFVRKKKPRKNPQVPAFVSETELRSEVEEQSEMKEEVVADMEKEELVRDRYEYLVQETNWLAERKGVRRQECDERRTAALMQSRLRRLDEIQNAFGSKTPSELRHGVVFRREEIIPGGGVVLGVDHLQRPSL